MYDIERQELVRNFIGHQSYVTKIKFNNVTNVLLSCGTDNSLMLWDIRTNKAVFKILGHPEPITSIDLSFDNTLICSSSHDGYVRLWDMLKATCLKTMVADSGSSSAIGLCKMTPNSKYLLFANLNSRIGMYNYQNELVKQYVGHQNQEYCMEALFVKNPETQRANILIGGEDGRLTAWDMNSQDVLFQKNIDPAAQAGSASSAPVLPTLLGSITQSQTAHKVISTLDQESKHGLVAACGNFNGVYVNSLSNMYK